MTTTTAQDHGPDAGRDIAALIEARERMDLDGAEAILSHACRDCMITMLLDVFTVGPGNYAGTFRAIADDPDAFKCEPGCDCHTAQREARKAEAAPAGDDSPEPARREPPGV